MSKNDLKNSLNDGPKVDVRKGLFFNSEENAFEEKEEVSEETQVASEERLSASLEEGAKSVSAKKEKELDKNDKKNPERIIRSTYYLKAKYVEAIRIMNFETNENISTIVNDALEQYFSQEILNKAVKNIKNGKLKR